MPVHLVPMSPERFPAWLERSRGEYERDLVVTGESEEDARRHSVESMEGAFAAGAPTAHNAVFDLVDEFGRTVGYLWVGRGGSGGGNSGDDASWWIWDVLVDEQHRGRGFGREAMHLAEEYARSQGAETLGLSVFAFNAAARGLYDSLGYEPVSVKMRKTL
ncbi:Acetyltransferase (GNAT) family protein [Agreia bicolorata]|uniref:Acetyltransferase (GNAT) family protein n=1 Tax=Agreia bicolorata TaxID=110935 RepID=A0A1T4WPW9_9MICO|nr:GNAT family N-acetyltransferase [Agreia bicolorata]SKA79157.1 Acetyltransferase (GNAT) family protein [Agreia bicolorata]